MQKNTLAAIICALSIFLFFVLVLPKYDSIKVYKMEIIGRQGILNERTAAFNKVRELDEQSRARQSDINKIQSFLPEHKQIDEVISSLKDITEKAGMQLSVLTTAEAQAYDLTNYKKLLISADLIGGYPSFVNFLKLLERSLRLYDAFEVTAAASAGGPSSISFAIKINAYYLK